MEDSELMRICSVGGNSVSAFLSWRLQATNACDVTLVWKSGFEHVSQYGISFKSQSFGNERFKPRRVVRNPEDASASGDPSFDYVVLCVKALPDVYDLASVIDSVVTPQHTCILVNTTNTLGVEAAIEERFPTNVVLSLVCGADLSQLGQSEFEHKGTTNMWIGPANRNSKIPREIQDNMADALAMTLNTGQVECKVSRNILQEQFERVIGPIAFHPVSIIFETPNHTALLEKVGVKDMVNGVLDELVQLAEANDCKFPPDFKQTVIADMTKPNTPDSIMWQDFMAKRPMEVETYLGSPLKLARDRSVPVPRIETLYAILHNLNVVNRTRPRAADVPGFRPPSSPTMTSPPPRMPSQAGHRPMVSGIPPGGGMPPRQPRPRNSSNFNQPPGMRRGPPPPTNGGPPNGYGRPPSHMNGGSRAPSRRGSMDGNDLEEFSHLVMYDDIPEGAESVKGGDSLREREMQLRQRELALRDQEMRQRRGPPPTQRRGPHPMRNSQQVFDDDDDDDDYDPMPANVPTIDPDNFDMMSMTQRKNRKAPPPTASQIRQNPEANPPASRGSRFRPHFGRSRVSQGPSAGIPAPGEPFLDDALIGATSNRYGAVDRGAMGAAGSRTNSLTASRLDDMQFGPASGGMPGMNGAYPRRTSQSPGTPYSPSLRGGGGRPSPPNGVNGRPSPPDGMRQPIPRFPPGQENAIAPQQVEQQVGVSNLQPPKSRNVGSLTGSASASAGSGEAESEPSAHSSQSSLQQHVPVGVR
ncbi:Ketopantoate reductase [Geosmithia morbida]|uniref:Ketopantoate reductase n=1 Tax=Geosmithia morbida TaxID=1094350 RepID=A0A9P4YWY0_9HYPO|nr:Ketopantoate reductase [Geosmithia morbida]KAF4124598.1 Ketopantoate reductase [Geosmithia morbida]